MREIARLVYLFCLGVLVFGVAHYEYSFMKDDFSRVLNPVFHICALWAWASDPLVLVSAVTAIGLRFWRSDEGKDD